MERGGGRRSFCPNCDCKRVTAGLTSVSTEVDSGGAVASLLCGNCRGPSHWRPRRCLGQAAASTGRKEIESNPRLQSTTLTVGSSVY